SMAAFTRARGPARGPRKAQAMSTQARVAEIRRRMAAMAWGPEVRLQLAKAWGLTDHRVSGLAAEASRMLACDESELKELRDRLAATLEEVIRHALEDRNAVTGQLDLRAAIDGVLQLSKFRGIAPPEAASKVALEGIVIHVSQEEARAFEPAHANGHAPPEPPALPRGDTH
ncbi:MAG TPA: hypothetical protein VET26_10130, partial [Candidatus Sulfotelmatobacter sp.]|nr:hypothetical protein [Candidatus Sulfotelmatobacter sp.]